MTFLTICSRVSVKILTKINDFLLFLRFHEQLTKMNDFHIIAI